MQASQLEAIQEYQLTIAEMQEEINEKVFKLKEKTHEQVTIIQKVVDPTGCADTNVPDGILHNLD